MNHHAHSRGRRLLAASAAILTAAGSVLLIGSAATAAPVAGPVTAQNGSITVYKHANPGFNGTAQNPDGTGGTGGDPLNGVTFQVCAISGIDLIAGGNAAWQEVRDLGLLAPAVTNAATTIGTAPARNLTSCTSATTATVGGKDGVATFTGLPVGAYLVRETAAPANVVEPSAPFVVTVPTPAVGADAGKWLYDVHVYPKNQLLDDPTKTIVDQQGNGLVSGAPIRYRITQRVPGIAAGESYSKFIVTDALDAKLKPGLAADVTVRVNGGTALVFGTDYNATWAGQNLTVTLLSPALDDLAQGDIVTVDFLATVLTNGAITNTAVVNVNDLGVGGTPGKTTPPVVTRWGSVDLSKVNASDHTSPLAGAEFELWMGQTAGLGCSTGNGNVKVADVVSDASGKLGTITAGVFTALPGLWVGDDSVVANDLQTRCYYVIETKAPAGFVLPATAAQRTTEFVVHPGATAHADAIKAIDNTQQTVPQLPLTGAAAQTLLIGGGTALVALAAVLLVLRRRKTAEF